MLTALPPSRTVAAAAAREADAVARARKATGRKPPQPLQQPANRSRPKANGRKWRKKIPLRFTVVSGTPITRR